MTIKFGDIALQEDIEAFRIRIQSIDMDKVKKETLKRISSKMAEMVRQAVFESSIMSPADKTATPYNRGDGPPLATKKAWQVSQTGANRYTIRPDPRVNTRARVLNFGYPGKITPNSAEALRFEINGIPVFRTEVEGPDETGYWQKAVNKMKSGGEFERVAKDELEKEFED